MAVNKFEQTIQTELPLRPFLSTDVEQEMVFVRRGLGPRQMQAIEIREGEVLGKVGGVLKSIKMTEVDAVSHNQTFTSARWNIVHNRNNTNVQVSLYDVNGNSFEPDAILTTKNQVSVSLAEPAIGRAVLIFAPATEAISFLPEESVLVPELITEAVTTSGVELPVDVLKEDGTLIAGNGVRNYDFTKSANNHLLLAIGARVRGNRDRFIPEVDAFTIELADTAFWNLVPTMALLDLTGGSVLTNYYDTVLTVSQGLESVVFTLDRAGSMLLLTDAEGLQVGMGSHTADLSVYQALLSSEHLAGLTSAVRNTAGAPLGEFTVTLTATPKELIEADVVTAAISVTVTAQV